MPQPSSSVHVNAPLTNLSIAFIQDESKFIASSVFPIVPSPKQSNRYFFFARRDFFRSEAKKRAPSTESAGSGYNIDNTPSFFCDKYSVHKDVAEEIRINADAPLDEDSQATIFVTQQLLLRREKDWSSRYFATGVWANESTPPSGLWDVATSFPTDDVEFAKDTVEQKTGFRPNRMVVSPSVHRKLKNHPDVKDRFKYTQKAIITEDMLAGLFEVEQYLVARAVEDRGLENAAEDMAYVFAGKHALLAYAPANPGINTPSAGYIFSWTGLLGGSSWIRIKKWWEPKIDSDRVEGDAAYDMKVVSDVLGYLLKDVIS